MLFRSAFVSIALAFSTAAGLTAAEHWAYQPPRRSPLPPITETQWAQNPIDYFTRARMEAAGLQPAPEADRATLARRAALALTGLPPTPEEVEAFVKDSSPDAYPRFVDRLLHSPRYGERMALPWLDLARYADTHGYHIDSHRDMWRWRDWVIQAYNQNMPFDQFTVEQLAGDLLPDPTLAQRIATGFNRNNMINFEGGAIAEEYLAEYVADRVATTGTVWMGQTLECARCHDHKYDPFTQREYYELFAFFNNVPEQGLDGKYGNAEPFVRAPTSLQQQHLNEVAVRIAKCEQDLQRRAGEATGDQQQWEQQLLAGTANSPKPPSDTFLHLAFNESAGEQISGGREGVTGVLQGNPIWVPGKHSGALLLDGSTHVELADLEPVDRDAAFSWGGWVFPTTNDAMAIVARVEDAETLRGFDLAVDDLVVAARLIHKWDDKAIQVRAQSPLAVSKWQHIMMTYDGSSQAGGIRIYVDGREQPLDIVHDTLDGSITTSKPLQIGRRLDQAYFRGMLDDLRKYERQLGAEEVALLAGGDPIREIASIAAADRSAEQRQTLQKYFLEREDAAYMQIKQGYDQAQRELQELERAIPTTMVMAELEQPRETFVLVRGQYHDRGERVTPATPAALPPLPDGAPANRLGLARWLVMPSHPLTARVAVNRFWQMHFGAGLVRTPEDFGTRGEAPTHPELLDWLAVEFVRSGWDVKHMHRLIVTSATFRQSSAARPGHWEADPENRLLARAPRPRLQAEEIRDSALLVSGLLHGTIGGPSVYPYQPPGLWEDISFNPQEFSAQVYKQSQGADLYRRSLYTFWKRTAPPPALATFDAPNRETCTVRRTQTNTPLQALVLMNDPTYVEAARELAERMLEEASASPSQRIAFAFQLVTARAPASRELEALLRLYHRQLHELEQEPAAALQLLEVGDSPPDTGFDTAELAAYTIVASTILSMDEAITRN